MTELKLAFRNIFRHPQRTLATFLAMALACAGLVLFGGYILFIHLSGETHATMMVGHLQIFKRGFYETGAGNPAAFAIEDYEPLRQRLIQDPEIGPRASLVTGMLVLSGIARNPESKNSAPFIAQGWVPADLARLQEWNPYQLFDMRQLAVNRVFFPTEPELDASEPKAGTLGVGLARILGMDLQRQADGSRARLELLCASPLSATPRIGVLYVRRAVPRGLKAFDDRLIFLPLDYASRLMFPGQGTQVTAIVMLLNRVEDVPAVAARLKEIIAQQGLELEVKTWIELLPVHQQAIRMIDLFFYFSLAIVAVVLAFMIYNTIMMGVLERTREIGTLRAMGASRKRVSTVFLLEGLILGLAGGGTGIVLGGVSAWLIDAAEILYQPPTIPFLIKLEILVFQDWRVPLLAYIGCLAVALAAAYLPARKASRLFIAEALRR
ncbi:MAG: FtsX-like permease family protein [Methylococcaceae bacterium]|nr:FtsX-like permease family protein [Methylococcaceae bacterium]